MSTTVQQAREDMAVIEEMMKQAEEVGEPGLSPDLARDLKNAQEQAGKIASITSAGHVVVYNTRTGQPVTVNRNMLPTQLRKKFADGKRAFSTIDPGIRPKVGKMKCLLHPDSGDREHYDRMGFVECQKSNIPSPFELDQHMRFTHPQEWKAIEAEQERAEKEAERAFQRSLLARMGGGTASFTETVTESPATTLEAPVQGTEDAPLYTPAKRKTCACGKTLSLNAFYRHKKNCAKVKKG